MTDITSSSPSIAERRASPRLSWARRLNSVAYQIAGVLTPGLAGRVAADAFGRSRAKGSRILFRMPLGAETFTIHANPDVQRGYLWKNHGPTVLLVHGWGSDSSSMIGMVKPLLAMGYQVASFDAPAHGESAGNKTTMTRFVNAVGAAIASLGSVELMIGHSLGSIASVAAIAQAERRYAQAIRRLVLIAAPVSLATVLESWAANQNLPAAVTARIYQRLHVQNGVPVSHWDISTLGAALELPVLVIHDEHDQVVPFCEAQKLYRSLRQVSLEQTTGLGHSRILSAAPVKQLICDFFTPSHLTSTRLELSND